MAGPIPTGLLPDTASIYADGRLRIGGCDLVDLAGEYSTDRSSRFVNGVVSAVSGEVRPEVSDPT